MYCTHRWSPFIFFTCTLWNNRRATLGWPPRPGLDDDESSWGWRGSSKSTSRGRYESRSVKRERRVRVASFLGAHTHTTILVPYVTNFWDTTEISNL